MRTDLFRVLVLWVSVLFLMACSTSYTKEAKPLPTLTYEHLDPVQLRVAEIVVENRYGAADNVQDVSGQFPVPPDIALQRYARHRFTPESGAGDFLFVIEDASVILGSVERERQWYEVFTSGKSSVYDINLKLRLYHQYAGTDAEGQSGYLSFSKRLVIPDTFSVDAREQTQLQAVETMIAEADKEIISYIHQYFPSLVE